MTVWKVEASFFISMVIDMMVTGLTGRNLVSGAISMQMARNTKDNEKMIWKMEEAVLCTLVGIFMMEIGLMD